MANSKSLLKSAFETARSESNIDVILPVLLKANLFVVAKPIPTENTPVFYLQRSPSGGDRLCVTVSEETENLAGIQQVQLLQMTGQQLIEQLREGIEIVVVYSDGGDYLTREQLTWFRKSIRNAQ